MTAEQQQAMRARAADPPTQGPENPTARDTWPARGSSRSSHHSEPAHDASRCATATICFACTTAWTPAAHAATPPWSSVVDAAPLGLLSGSRQRRSREAAHMVAIRIRYGERNSAPLHARRARGGTPTPSSGAPNQPSLHCSPRPMATRAALPSRSGFSSARRRSPSLLACWPRARGPQRLTKRRSRAMGHNPSIERQAPASRRLPLMSNVMRHSDCVALLGEIEMHPADRFRQNSDVGRHSDTPRSI